MQASQRNIISIVAAVVLVLAGLSPLVLASDPDLEKVGAPSVEKLAGADNVALAEQIFAKVAAHDAGYIQKMADVEIDAANLPRMVEQMAGLFPPEQPKAVTVLEANFSVMKFPNAQDSSTLTSMRLEYQYSKTWLLTEIVLSKKGSGEPRIAGIHAVQENDSLQNTNRFTLSGQNGAHYAVLAAAIAELAFSAFALALCIRTPIAKRKWAWVIFTTFGACSVHFNWLTGGLFFDPISVHIPVASFSKMLYEPMILTLTAPVGAIAFLLRPRSLQAG